MATVRLQSRFHHNLEGRKCRRWPALAFLVVVAAWSALAAASAQATVTVGSPLTEPLVGSLSPGDVVALALPTIPEYLVSYLAVAKLGGITTGVNARLSAPEREALLTELQAMMFAGQDPPPPPPAPPSTDASLPGAAPLLLPHPTPAARYTPASTRALVELCTSMRTLAARCWAQTGAAAATNAMTSPTRRMRRGSIRCARARPRRGIRRSGTTLRGGA